jgi:hypothetical protein
MARKKPGSPPAKAKRIRRSPRKKKAVATGPYDASWVKDHPIRHFSKKISDYPWKASTPLGREDENPPKSCVNGYCIIGKFTDRRSGERRWIFSFPTRDERNTFVLLCETINGCSARRELHPTGWLTRDDTTR